jgi:hypothetical protein
MPEQTFKRSESRVRRERISYLEGAIDGISKWNKATNEEKDTLLRDYQREINRLNKQLGY